jgi:hypothetical protein
VDLKNEKLKKHKNKLYHMEIYKITTCAVLTLGVGHALYSFKKFKSIEANALWFFSTSLGLIFNGFLNYINIQISNNLISNLTISANSIQFAFCTVLVYYVRNPPTYIAILISTLILGLSLVY